MSDTKIIQPTRKSSYFAFVRIYEGQVTGFSSSLDDFSVDNIIDFKSIDITQISYSSPTKVKGGSYMSIPTYQGKKIFIFFFLKKDQLTYHL